MNFFSNPLDSTEVLKSRIYVLNFFLFLLDAIYTYAVYSENYTANATLLK